MTNPIRIVLLLIISSFTLVGCHRNTVYSHYESVPMTGWHKDKPVDFSFTIEDTTALYQVLLNIRHTETYPYQNMWLFVGTDSLEIYLADERGAWLGNGRNGLINMPVLYRDSVRFEHSGPQHVSVQHGMYDTELQGVSDVGIEVKKIQ